ncbi:hypothetical protein M405DRAFT_832219, partial [Rhizopogon salebrosus TDB-379]
MSDHELAPKTYTIESVSWKGQYVSVDDDTIVGFRHLLGGIQKWELAYKNGFATFQGVPPYPAVRKYIAIDWNAMELVYGDEPTPFKLERLGGGHQNIFRVMAVNKRGHGSEGPVSWQLPSKNDGT